MVVQLQRLEDSSSSSSSSSAKALRGHDTQNWVRVVLEEQRRAVQLQHSWVMNKHDTLHRTAQFWKRSLSIYFSYKICQLRVQFMRSPEEQHKAWEAQHERAADKLYLLCSELGGFFLKAAQLIGKPDTAPDAWVKKLVTLCDAAPETPFAAVRSVLERELGLPYDHLFEKFEKKPIGSASIAQVHRARITGSTKDVAVKVQHPGVEELMMTDIRNLKTFAAFLQRFDLKFDLLSVVDELEEQVGYEFDFKREANSMNKIADSFRHSNHGKGPVIIPRPITGMVTRRVLVMEFMEGTPILYLKDEMARRGIDPEGPIATLAKRKILRGLALAYGQMILRDGYFQADPHPGNILINNQGEVVLLDYGQVKELPHGLRLNYAKLVLAIAADEALEIGRCLENLGLITDKKAQEDPESFKKMAILMFDTKMPPGMRKANPFGEDSMLKKFAVVNFPKELFFVLRTIQLLRGISIGMGVQYSCIQEWKQLAKSCLLAARQAGATHLSETSELSELTGATPRELVWERRKRHRRLFWNRP